MLFLATFVVDSVPFYGEALKHSLDILDLIVMQAAMNRSGKIGTEVYIHMYILFSILIFRWLDKLNCPDEYIYIYNIMS